MCPQYGSGDDLMVGLFGLWLLATLDEENLKNKKLRKRERDEEWKAEGF